ncbi:hypothetical protein ACFL1R_04970 [Candidatus Latescibacterota bacterium]
MSKKFIYRSFTSQRGQDLVRKKVTEILLKEGYVQTGSSASANLFRYPAIWFSSKRPLTCISALSLEVHGLNGNSLLKMGVTFTKIRYSIILIMVFFCVILPGVIGFIKSGVPEVPPMSFLGIPLGFMAHFHVRGRVFRALERLVDQI